MTDYVAGRVRSFEGIFFTRASCSAVKSPDQAERDMKD
jgi:hypothetical protein